MQRWEVVKIEVKVDNKGRGWRARGEAAVRIAPGFDAGDGEEVLDFIHLGHQAATVKIGFQLEDCFAVLCDDFFESDRGMDKKNIWLADKFGCLTAEGLDSVSVRADRGSMCQGLKSGRRRACNEDVEFFSAYALEKWIPNGVVDHVLTYAVACIDADRLHVGLVFGGL